VGGCALVSPACANRPPPPLPRGGKAAGADGSRERPYQILTHSECEPFINVDSSGNVRDGYTVDQLESIQKLLLKEQDVQFNHELTAVPRGTSFNGMLASLNMNGSEFNFAAGCFTKTWSREEELVDWTTTHFPAGSGILVRKGNVESLMDSVLNHMFEAEAMNVIGSVIILIILFAHPFVLLEHGRPGSVSEYLDRLSRAMWFMVVTLTTVGYGDVTPDTAAGKMLSVLWMFTGLVTFGLYTGKMTAVLTLRDVRPPSIRSLQDIKGKEICTLKGSIFEPVVSMNQGILKSEDSLEDCMQNLELGLIEGVLWDWPAFSLIADGKQDKVTLSYTSETDSPFGFAFPQGTSYDLDSAASMLLEQLDVEILRYMQSPAEQINRANYILDFSDSGEVDSGEATLADYGPVLLAAGLVLVHGLLFLARRVAALRKAESGGDVPEGEEDELEYNHSEQIAKRCDVAEVAAAVARLEARLTKAGVLPPNVVPHERERGGGGEAAREPGNGLFSSRGNLLQSRRRPAKRLAARVKIAAVGIASDKKSDRVEAFNSHVESSLRRVEEATEVQDF